MKARVGWGAENPKRRCDYVRRLHVADLIFEAVAAHLDQRRLALGVVLDIDHRARQLLRLEKVRTNLALVAACSPQVRQRWHAARGTWREAPPGV